MQKQVEGNRHDRRENPDALNPSQGEDRYRKVFENSPIAIGEEDFSAVKTFLDDLRTSGVADLEAFIAQHPEAVAACAGLVRIIDSNHAALQLHGASSKEELQAGLVRTLTPESLETFKALMICLWNGETTLARDTAVRTFSGDLRQVTVYFSVCPGYEETLSKVLISLVDITSRKRIENTLRFTAQLGWAEQSDSFLSSLARYLGETLGVAYVVIDRLSENPGEAETVALYANGALVPNMRYILQGTPCDNVMGKRLCYYPQGVQALFPADSLLVEMGVESYAGIPLWDASGKGIGLIAVMDQKPMHDEEAVTQILQLVAVSAAAFLEREQADLLLRQREQEFRTLANNIPDLIVRYDSELRRTFVNRAWEEASGLTAAEVVNVPAANIPKVPSPIVEEYVDKIHRVLATGTPEKVEFSWVNAGGETLFLEYLIVPEYGYEGKIIGVLSVGRDITARKEAEGALLKLNSELELRVRKRTAELEKKNEELKRMNKLFVGRELRMVELKERIRELEKGHGS